MWRIESLVDSIWPRLLKREKVEIPAHEVEHPARRPDLFGVPPAAWPAGQRYDFVWRLRNGSRVHAQCFENESIPTVRFHLDKYDPDSGLGNVIMHLVLETPVGPILGVLVAVVIVARVVRS